MTNTISELLRAHAGELLYPGWQRLVFVLILSYGVVVTSLVVAWRLDALRGRAGRLVTTLLALSGLAGSLALGALHALPLWARSTTTFAGANVDAMALAGPVGAAVLAPAVRAFTRDGEDDDALFAIERRGGGIDLAALTTPDGRKRASLGVTAARLRAEYDRIDVSARLSHVPPWVVSRVERLVDDELVALAAAYPTLIAALTPAADGTLPVARAQKQVAEALLTTVLPDHVERLLHATLAATRTSLISTWFGALALCVLVRVAFGLWRRSKRPELSQPA